MAFPSEGGRWGVYDVTALIGEGGMGQGKPAESYPGCFPRRAWLFPLSEPIPKQALQWGFGPYTLLKAAGFLLIRVVE